MAFRKIYLGLVFLFASLLGVNAQEINSRVVVNAGRVNASDPRIFTDMEGAFTQFLNNRKWTELEYKTEEKINCNIIINLRTSSSTSAGNYEADVQIQSSRPIYGGNYESLIFNYADRDWIFEYTQSQPLNFNENNFSSNITSLLAFYAYIIIAFDQDSFEKKAGDTYFLKAQSVVNNAQQGNYVGWSQFGNNTRSRYFLVDGLLNQQMSPVREAYYDYHRLALDQFLTDQDKARTLILESLKNIKKINDVRPNALITTIFMDAKSEELINIFSKGNLQIRKSTYDILAVLDPSKKDKFQVILK